jgi:hypothetical protein
MGAADGPPKQPHHGAAAKAGKAAREARLAAAMRDNLRKRRQQRQARDPDQKSRDVKPS